ncbi:MAG: hypothetical protein Q4C71_05375 [Microbacteriaceae bacterium]|nr:hypothetical protein [Microbacteriaceae bacterium]
MVNNKVSGGSGAKQLLLPAVLAIVSVVNVISAFLGAHFLAVFAVALTVMLAAAFVVSWADPSLKKRAAIAIIIACVLSANAAYMAVIYRENNVPLVTQIVVAAIVALAWAATVIVQKLPARSRT